jgi:hypothetical protein
MKCDGSEELRQADKVGAYEGEGAKSDQYDCLECAAWLDDSALCSHLIAFAKTSDSADVEFVLAERAYRESSNPDEDAMHQAATHIYSTFFADDSDNQILMESSQMKQMQMVLNGSKLVPHDLFAAGAALALKRIQNHLFPAFKSSDLYDEALREKQRAQAGEIARGKSELKQRLGSSESKAELETKLSGMDAASRARIRMMMGSQ